MEPIRNQIDGSEPGSLRRAKRLFASSLFLAFGLIALGLLNHNARSPRADGPPSSGNETVDAIFPWINDLDLHARLAGEAAALAEHPSTMPKFEPGWAELAARKRLQRDPVFGALPPERFEAAAKIYYEAYAARFDDYYDASAAYRLGYQYGLQVDPAIHSFLDGAFALSALSTKAAELRARYDLDDGEWYWFAEKFLQGFKFGRPIILEGVTKGPGEEFSLEIE